MITVRHARAAATALFTIIASCHWLTGCSREFPKICPDGEARVCSVTFDQLAQHDADLDRQMVTLRGYILLVAHPDSAQGASIYLVPTVEAAERCELGGGVKISNLSDDDWFMVRRFNGALTSVRGNFSRPETDGSLGRIDLIKSLAVLQSDSSFEPNCKAK